MSWQEEVFDRYVDDELEGLAADDPGVRFEGGELVVDEEQVEEDQLVADIMMMMRGHSDFWNTFEIQLLTTIDEWKWNATCAGC